MEENKEKKTIKQKALQGMAFLMLFLLSGVIAGGGSFLYGQKEGDIICNTVMVLLGTGIVIFALISSEVYGLYFYENGGSYKRFCIFYLLGLCVSLLFPLLPVAGWPFLVIFVILSLFSNSISGLVAGSVCLMLSVMLADGIGYREFCLYFFSGLVGIMVFNRLNESFKVGIPIFISLLCLMVCLSTNLILFEKERLSISQFVMVAINLMINFILLLIILKIFSNTVIHKDQDIYMDLNDPECPLLVQLKELSKQEYYHAVHTAYLGDRIARRLGLDEKVVKACGYYHRIGQLKGENTWENVKGICKEYHIPAETSAILKEYIESKKRLSSKEATVILFADTIVESISSLFAQNPKAELNYEQIIDTIFKEKLKSGELWQSQISIVQIRQMKKIFSEEKLYYDFLR
ncbi:MAG: hypothetical protein NC419_08835 [Muribaculaceae bacterium]|nr:hypothetical protein [Muribaculaceae bacterium]